VRLRDSSGQMILPVDEILRYVDTRAALRCGDLVFATVAKHP